MFGLKEDRERIVKLEDRFFDIYSDNLKLKTQVEYLLNQVNNLLHKKCDKCGK